MRERDFVEFAATSNATTREEMADLMVARYGGRDDVICGFCNGEPTTMGAAVEVWPGVISVLFFATDNFPRISIGLTCFLQRELVPRLLEAGVHRIQAVSMQGHDDAHRWLQVLGLKQEAVFPGFGKNGEDFVQFAMVKPCL
jgi:hypothetical protein